MSRWLKSVNNLLDKLDDQVDISDAAAFTQRMAARVGGAVQQPNSDESDDDDEMSDEEDSYDASESSSVDDDDDEDDEDDDDNEQEEEDKEVIVDTEVNDHEKDELFPLRNNPADPMATPGPNYNYSEDVFFTPMEQIRREHITEIITPPREGLSPIPSQSISSQTSNTDTPVRSDQTTNASILPAKIMVSEIQASNKPSLKSPPNSGVGSSVVNKSKIMKKLKQDNQRLQQLHAALEKSNLELNNELEHARGELNAQHEELQLAAERMEKDRIRKREEREELLEEQEEELHTQKEDYENRLAEQKHYYEKELRDMRVRLQEEEHKRLDEGGDWTKELEDTLQRERDALKELASVKAEKQQLESKVTTLETQRESLQEKVSSLKETSRNSIERERIAEEKLDNEMNQHKRQMGQKQEREAQLERTVAELSTALTMAQQMPPSLALSTDEYSSLALKTNYENVLDDLETTKSQLSHITQQNHILQSELQDMSRERAVDANLIQSNQREHDEQVRELNRRISHLEANLRSLSEDHEIAGANVPTDIRNPDSHQHIERLSRDLDLTKRQLATSTGQLIEQKRLSDSFKAEGLALKGRLQSAIERAEMAENALASHSSSATTRSCEMGEASYSNARTVPRRRVRGGRGRFGHLPSRSMISFLGMHVVPGSIGEQISTTVDALDSWMLETGHIFRHEPLARLGFAIYFTIVHLWCLGLVFFHTVQSEHSDLVSLTTHKGPLT